MREPGLTFGTTSDAQRADTRASWNRRDVGGTARVLVLIVGA